MYQAFVLRTNLLLGKFLCPYIAEKSTSSLLHFAFLIPLQLSRKPVCSAEPDLWGAVPAFGAVPSLAPLSLCPMGSLP